MEALLHIPMNLRGYVMEEVEDFLFNQRGKGKTPPVVSQPAHDHSISWLEERIKSRDIPDMAMAHISDFSKAKDLGADLFFQPSPMDLTASIRPEFQKFYQRESMYTPIYFMPAVLIMKDTGVESASSIYSWEKVAQMNTPIAMPDSDTPISKVVLSFLKKHSPLLYEAFLSKVTFVGSPPQVIEKVIAGEFEIGVANQSFSLMGESRGIQILPVEEGAIPLPQVMVQKRNSRITNPMEISMKASLQQYIQKQGAWPAMGKDELCGFQKDNQWIAEWDSWEEMLKIIGSVEKDLKTK